MFHMRSCSSLVCFLLCVVHCPCAPQAPNYSEIIKNPMDLSTIKTKIEGGMYNSWNEIAVSACGRLATIQAWAPFMPSTHVFIDVAAGRAMSFLRDFRTHGSITQHHTSHVGCLIEA